MKKQVIRLTESDLHKIIKESVRRALNESWFSGKIKVYHYTNERNAQAIMNGGFKKSKFNTNGGNLYGPAVYLSLDPNREIALPYGNTIIEGEVYANNAIFLDFNLAQKFAHMSPSDVVENINDKLGPEAAQRFTELVERGTPSSIIAYDLIKEGLLDYKHDIVFNAKRGGPIYVARNVHSITPLRILNQ